jgi:outer membrane protein assembly factor BamB
MMLLLRTFSLLIFLGVSACAGKNIYKNATTDTEVLTRGWTLSSAASFERNAGDRGFEYGSMVTFENTLIYGTRGEGMVSLYPHLQKKRWTNTSTGGVQSPVLLEKKNLYFQGSDGFFYSLEADSGKVRWKTDLKTSFASKPSFWNGRVFVSTPHDSIYALDAGTGKVVWVYRRRSADSTNIRLCSSPLVRNTDVFVGLSDGYLISLNPEDGALKWEKKLHLAKKFTDIDASPLLAGDKLLVPTYDGELFALQPKSGDVIWKNELGGARKPTLDPTDPTGTFYFPSSTGTVSSIDLNSGKVKWKFDLDAGVPTEVLVSGDRLIFGSSTQYIYVLNKGDGKLLYRFNLGDGSGVASDPYLDDRTGAVYFLSHAGNLYQFFVRKMNSKQGRDLYSPATLY